MKKPGTAHIMFSPASKTQDGAIPAIIVVRRVCAEGVPKIPHQRYDSA